MENETRNFKTNVKTDLTITKNVTESELVRLLCFVFTIPHLIRIYSYTLDREKYHVEGGLFS